MRKMTLNMESVSTVSSGSAVGSGGCDGAPFEDMSCGGLAASPFSNVLSQIQ